jgi:hypothetical protein
MAHLAAELSGKRVRLTRDRNVEVRHRRRTDQGVAYGPSDQPCFGACAVDGSGQLSESR